MQLLFHKEGLLEILRAYAGMTAECAEKRDWGGFDISTREYRRKTTEKDEKYTVALIFTPAFAFHT